MPGSKEIMELEISLLMDMGRRYGVLVQKARAEARTKNKSKNAIDRGGRRNGTGRSENHCGRL